MIKLIFANILVFLVVFGVYADEKDSLQKERTEQAIEADESFWDFTHGKDYQRFNHVLDSLNEAQLRDPKDVYTTAHIAWTNFWAFAEGVGKGIAQPDNVLQYMQNAEQSFAKAHELAPNEPRILGFLGYARLALGGTTDNIDLIVKGQADVARSIELWPEWGLFGAAYGLDARSPYNSPQFEQALGYYWTNMDVCANTQVDRQYPDWAAYVGEPVLQGPDRACWNSWIAPYNGEGFFLVVGDALVKAGNIEVARIIYNNAKLYDNYNSWPYRDFLERRINNINENIENFRQPIAPNQPADPETSLLVRTRISCAICHRGDADKNFKSPAWVGEKANQYLVPFK